MEDKLVTLAILTYAKAQILKNVLENEGIETYIHNVNQIQPVVSSGVRVRIKESDLPHALKITESSAWLSEEVVGGKSPKLEKVSNKVLIPVDFSNYSLKACEFGFNFAQNIGAEVVLLHVYFTPIYATSLPYGDVFNYQLSDEENVRSILQKVHADLNALSDKVKEDTVVIEQITNNTKEQAMLGGFEIALNDAVIESLDVHQNMATQVLSKDKVREGLADIVYGLLMKGLSASSVSR